ncbi:MAG: hypothetical protein ACLUNZ_05705 [Evtepia sp.]
MVAAAIISAPKLLICDEPTTALDVIHSRGYFEPAEKDQPGEGDRHPVHLPQPPCGAEALHPRGGDVPG